MSKRYSDGSMFYFKPNKSLLYTAYKSNQKSLNWLNSTVVANRAALQSGEVYLEIFAYIPASEVGDARAINWASIQGSVVRAYIKTQYGISHDKCTFAIDTTQNLQNVIQVQLVSGTVPRYSNQQISYSSSRSASSAQRAVRDYRNGVPYMSYLMYLAKRDVAFGQGGDFYALRDGQWTPEELNEYIESTPLSELAEVGGLDIYIKRADGEFISASQSDINQGVNILYAKNADGTFHFAGESDITAAARKANTNIASPEYLSATSSSFVRTEPYAVSDAGHYRDYPIFAFKTNLLYWAIALPNIEMEFFIGKRFSINIEGRYTWMSEVLGNQKSYYTWGAGAEFRVWFKGDNKFEGFYAGIGGETGQYDFKFTDDGNGNQGDYYTAGVSFGYLMPINKHLNMEFGIGVGYVNYQDKEYLWSGKKFEPADKMDPIKTNWGIFPTKAKVSLVWKF